jgi:mannose-6-phosphate isomerase-like protein (cupin superfamily)
MSKYEVINIGAPDKWWDYVGGFRPTTTKNGRRVVDHEMNSQYIGMTVNAAQPGDQSGYWHDHTQVEEVYIFLSGQGKMGLGKDVIDVETGSVVRISQGVMRAWRANPDSKEQLTWLCIRAGGTELTEYPDDAIIDRETPFPW